VVSAVALVVESDATLGAEVSENGDAPNGDAPTLEDAAEAEASADGSGNGAAS
jgi:hypothetical protein